MKNIQTLIDDINDFLSNIEDGDQYIDGEPELEDGLQLDLYLYLKDLGYQVVYELELPDLKQYLDTELNEQRVYGYKKGSLRPDLVVNLGTEGFACFELKYNETDDDELNEDAAKSRVYVKHCSEVHFAGYIHLYRIENRSDVYEGTPCNDEGYEYSFYGCNDNPKEGLRKSISAKSIRLDWNKRSLEIKNGEGKFAEYE